MNGAHIHLLFNHIPVIGAIFGVILLVAALLVRRVDVARAGLLVLFIAALTVIPTYLSGSGAAHVVRGMPDVTADVLGAHIRAAKIAFYVTDVVGLIALFGLIAYRRSERIPGWYTAVSLVAGLAAMVMLAGAALEGGEIRHTEVRDDFTPPAARQPAAPVDTAHAPRSGY